MYLVRDDGLLVEMKEQAYDSEDLLQGLLAKYPNLLAGDQIDSVAPRRWLLISREVSVPSEDGGGAAWWVDHLFFDQDAIPTLVEVKRSSDTRIRREVVGQMLDYAANAVVYWPVETLRSWFEKTCATQGRDSAQALLEFLGSDADVDGFWQTAKTNLQAGKIRLVFVADKIPPELQRIVEFLNGQMDPAEVLAVEIKQYLGQGLRTLVPRVIGRTAEAQKKNAGTVRESRNWDEDTFFQELTARKSAEEADVARAILEWAKVNMPRIWWGKGVKDGGFVPVLDFKEVSHQVIEVWTNGTIEIQFQWMRGLFSEASKRLEFLNRLNQIHDVNIPGDAINRRPWISLAVLIDEVARNQFLDILDWYVSEIKAS